MRTILFDIDGTLLMTHGGGSLALQQAVADVFGIRDPSVDITFGGRTDRSILSELLTINGLDDTHANREALRLGYVGRFPEVLREVGGALMPGVMPLMEALTGQSGIRSYVMTGNFEQTGRHKLDHFGLGRFFRGVFGGDHDAHRDDLAHRTARSIVDRYGPAAIDDVVVVGDTVADIRCGHAIGAKVIAVCTGGQTREQLESERPLAVTDDLSQTEAILGLLC